MEDQSHDHGGDEEADDVHFRSLSREEELHLKSDRPPGSTAWRLHVVERLQTGVDWLVTDLEDLADAAADRKTPSLARGRIPVRRDDRGARQIPALEQIVVDEGLQQQLTHIRTITGACHRPKLARQYPDHPRFWC